MCICCNGCGDVGYSCLKNSRLQVFLTLNFSGGALFPWLYSSVYSCMVYGVAELQWTTEMLFIECLPSGHMLARLKLGKLDGVSRLQTMALFASLNFG